MWQALLLSQTQLTQGLGHLTTSHLLTVRITNILVNFLPPQQLSLSHPTPAKPGLGTSASTFSPVKRTQASPAVGIMLVLKLWSVVKNVLASSCLSNMAERILDAVMAKEYPLSKDEKLEDAWSALCSDLVISSFGHAVTLVLRPPSSSIGSEKPNLSTTGTNTRQELWRIVAESWRGFATGVSWETGLQLLMIARG